MIWHVLPESNVSIVEIEDAVRAVFRDPAPADGIGNVLVITLGATDPDNAIAYLDRLAEQLRAVGVHAAVQGWSVTASRLLEQALFGPDTTANILCNEVVEADKEFIRLLRRSRDVRSRNQVAEKLETKSKLLLGGLGQLCEWAACDPSPNRFSDFLRRADAESCRIGDLAGLLVGGPHQQTAREAERAGEIVMVAARNHELKIALGSLPVGRSTVEALVAAEMAVRVAVGLITKSEFRALPPPWTGYPVNLWRRGRSLGLLP